MINELDGELRDELDNELDGNCIDWAECQDECILCHARRYSAQGKNKFNVYSTLVININFYDFINSNLYYLNHI